MSELGPECPNVDVRDALPALLHDRLPGTERRRVEAHVAACAACRDEVALLRALRGAGEARPVRVNLDAIGARVVRAMREADVARAAPVARPLAIVGTRSDARAAAVPPSLRRPRIFGGLRAAAAVLLVLGTGAALIGRQADGPSDAPTQVAAARPTDGGAAVTGGSTTPAGGPVASARDRQASAAPGRGTVALGASFGDLDDAELAAVLAAIESDDAPLPALEPEGSAAEYRGGDS